MHTPEEYMGMARKAGEEGAHVAAITYFRNAAEATENSADVEGIVESAVDYAGKLKKPTDRKAVYDWARAVAGQKLEETGLTERIETAMQELGGEQNGTSTTAA